MSISEKLLALKTIKDNIKNAIISKGVEVGSSTPFSLYAEKIMSIIALTNLGEKTITANGIYLPELDDKEGYSKVTVNVPTATDWYAYSPYSSEDITRTIADDVNSFVIVQNPAMTSNSMDGWVASANYYTNNEQPYKAFDKNYTGDVCWWTGDNKDFSQPAWVMLEFPTARKIYSVEIANESVSPENFKNAELQFLNAVTNQWETLYTIVNRPNITSYSETYTINSDNTYTAFRLYITSGYTNGSRCSLQNVNINFKE